MRIKHLLSILIVSIFLCMKLFAQEATNDSSGNPDFDQYYESQKKAMDSKWKSQHDEMEKDYNDKRANMEKEWARLIKEQDEQQARFQVEIEEKWQEFNRSTPIKWVEYNQSQDAVSMVDFEKGTVVFEVIVKDGEPMALENVKKKIATQAEKIFWKQDLSGKTTMDNQIASSKGYMVNPDNLNRYLKEDVLPEIKPDPIPFTSKDKIKRRKYTARVGMVKDHVKIRAEKYMPVVEKNARRFNIDPGLVMATIHTESHFNPNARSQANAIGMMQILPRFAGREAYKMIYGEDKIITTEYLFDPENNIELGCAYLKILMYRYFKNVDGEMKRKFVTICGYNCGPTFMRRKIINQHNLSVMSDKEVYDLLKLKTPKETRGYIEKVTGRIPLYDLF
jgi:membrane-bound lytic murein transglycosylase C